MAIYLPGNAEDQALALDEMTPREIVAELDKYVVGQAAAKRAVAIALRNRTRRQRLAPELAEEIMPKNILMIGSTGVGKTEIARRLAKLTNSPFLKVEASKFTEVGYVGRDVESIVRDLLDIAIDMVREEKLEEVEDRAELAAEDRLIELLLTQGAAQGGSSQRGGETSDGQRPAAEAEAEADAGAEAGAEAEAGADIEAEAGPTELKRRSTDTEREGPPPPSGAEAIAPALGNEEARARDRLVAHFREGRLDDRMVELETRERAQPQIEVISNAPDEMEQNGIKEMLANLFGQRTRKRTMKVIDAFDYLTQEEESRLLDMDHIIRIAIERVEDSGMVFLDEIDKIAGREGSHGPEISREGVQRDILPIVEGTTVSTKYGMVATDHILFVAAGAFHVSKPSDLIPELQGRFPIRVELQPLTAQDFLRILTEPRAALTKQAIALLETEGLKLEFAPEALEEIARFAFQINETTENIGARRLHTIMEKVLDEISFAAADIVKAAGTHLPDKLPPFVERTVQAGDGTSRTERVLIVDRAYVQSQVAGIAKNQDLSRYIL